MPATPADLMLFIFCHQHFLLQLLTNIAQILKAQQAYATNKVLPNSAILLTLNL